MTFAARWKDRFAALMTYCLGIITKHGLVMASDSRTNAGFDQANVVRKMYTFVQRGERVFVALVSGSLSLSQSVMTLLKRDFVAFHERFREGQGIHVPRTFVITLGTRR